MVARAYSGNTRPDFQLASLALSNMIQYQVLPQTRPPIHGPLVAGVPRVLLGGLAMRRLFNHENLAQPDDEIRRIATGGGGRETSGVDMSIGNR